MKLPYWKVISDKPTYGDAFMFRVRLNPSYADNEAIIAHEYAHVKQWYLSMIYVMVVVCGLIADQRYEWALYAMAIGLPLHNLLSTFSRWYRARIEAEAFAAQLDVVGWDKLDVFARSLAYKYDLNISVSEAKKLIQRAM